MDYDIYPLLFFYFILLFVTFWFTDFYLFVLGSSLLISFLSLFVPVLFSTIGSWCPPPLHMLFLPNFLITLKTVCTSALFLFVGRIYFF